MRRRACEGVIVACLGFAAFTGCLPARALAQGNAERQRAEQPPNVKAEAGDAASGGMGQGEAQAGGVIRGTVADKTGTLLVGAHVRLMPSGGTPSAGAQETTTGEDGQFTFVNAAAGSFTLTITAAGFAAGNFAGTLHTGEALTVPQITLVVATEVTEIHVEVSQVELAQEEIKEQEKQRVLGVIPNFYVTYVPNAAPLRPKQKFELAWKATLDPVTFGVTGLIAGVEQADGQFSGYGQGAQGYGKRYGAAYADIVTSTFIGGAILPSLLKQDPRYFYKGTGSTKSRVMYAIANAFICKGDNGKWQPNYSSILGSLAAGGISNLYYPSSDRNGVGLTFENTAIGIGATAGVNILQEFVLRKLTPKARKIDPGTT